MVASGSITGPPKKPRCSEAEVELRSKGRRLERQQDGGMSSVEARLVRIWGAAVKVLGGLGTGG